MSDGAAGDGVDPGTTAGEPRAAISTPWQVALRAPLAALTLLTIVPVPARAQARIGAREVAASAPFFPLVGAVLGVVIGAVGHAAAAHSTLLLAAAVAVVLLAALTGALHLDGLADAADALGARGGSRERRLEIMRDSSTGAYGTAAVAGWFVLVGAAVASIPADGLAVSLGLAAALARAMAVLHANALPPARTGGLGAGFQMNATAVLGALVMLALVVAGAAALPYDNGWLSGPGTTAVAAATIAALVTATLVGVGAYRLIGGRTGDTLGATIALSEAAALLAVALALG